MDSVSNSESAPLRLVAGPPDGANRVEGQVTLSISGEPLALELSVPDGPVSTETMLPIIHGVANAIVARGVAAVEREGKRVSCAAGCGACCRQIVPLAEGEVRAIARLVEELPEPRRSIVRERFELAMRRLVESDAIDLLNRGDRPPQDTIDLILRYFRLDIPCPFLEDEACSIHPQRPVICREYLVTSDPVHCAELAPGAVKRVPLAANIARALLTASHGTEETSAWIPLIAALRFVAAKPEPEPTRTAPQVLGAFFSQMTN